MQKTYGIWDDYYRHRLDWAYKAKDDFIQSIENNTYKELYKSSSDKSVNIAVYGQSQVGKTTLILKLIGIKEEHYKYVSDVLRADIRKGESVTPTSVIYIKSNDNDFYYKEGDNVCKVTADELKLKLKDLRARVEKNIEINNLNDGQSNVLINIPKKYFEEKNTLNINIIDLPGYGSANEKEQRHVKKLIESKIPILNLILIVSDKITDLQNIKIPCRQFRYILTRSVSSRSVEKKFKENSISNKDKYLEFVRSQFEKLPNDVKVYPLEYGDSWSNLDVIVKNKAEGIIDELFEDLRKDISDSSTEYNQLMQNANHFKYIEKMIEQEKEEFDICIKTKEKKLEDLNQDKSLFQIHHDNNSKEIKKRRSERLDINYNFRHSIPKYSGHITRDNLITFISNFSNDICSNSKKELNKLNSKYPQIIIPNISNFHEICFNQSIFLLRELKKYYLNRYILTSSQEKDKEESEKVCKNIFDEIKRNFETTIRKTVNTFNNDNDNKINENEKREKDLNYKIPKNQTSIEMVEKEIKELESKREKFSLNSSKDLEKAKKFKEFIKNGYTQESNKTIAKMNDFEASKEVVFFNLLYLSLITSEFEKLNKQPV
jgi:GTPase SAR1 family protein